MEYDNRELLDRMIDNLKRTMCRDEKKEKCNAVVVQRNNKRDFPSLMEMIKLYMNDDKFIDVLGFCINRVAVVKYGKFTFAIYCSYYDVGTAVVLVKTPTSKEVIVGDDNRLFFDRDYYNKCFDICDESDKYMVENKYNELNTLDELMKAFDKWKRIPDTEGKGLHGKRRYTIKSDDELFNKPNMKIRGVDFNIKDDSVKEVSGKYSDYINEIKEDDSMIEMYVNMINEAMDQFNENNDNEKNKKPMTKLDILMENVKIFDIGTIMNMEQLTNLTRYIYHEYYFNDNVQVYNIENDDSEIMPGFDLKFMLREFDVFLQDLRKVELKDRQMNIDTLIDLLDDKVHELCRRYELDLDLSMYCEGTRIGMYDENNKCLLYVMDMGKSVRENYFSPNIMNLDEVDRPINIFVSRLANETQYFEWFIHLMFLAPDFSLDHINKDNNEEGDN